jgi:hypothetical protein
LLPCHAWGCYFFHFFFLFLSCRSSSASAYVVDIGEDEMLLTTGAHSMWQSLRVES